MQLKKFPDIPVSTWEEHRVSCHNSKRASFSPPHLEMRVHFPASSGKEYWCSSRTSRGVDLIWNSWGTPGVRPQFQEIKMSQYTPDKPDSPALTRLSRRVSTQNTMAGITALWHLKRKLQIPMATRQHSLCYLFWESALPPIENWKGDRKITFSYLKEFPTFWCSFFHWDSGSNAPSRLLWVAEPIMAPCILFLYSLKLGSFAHFCSGWAVSLLQTSR